jgi:cell division protein FtsW
MADQTVTSKAIKADDTPQKKGYDNIGDPVIWGIYIVLILVSLVECFSSSGQMIKSAHMYAPIFKHAIILFAGFVLLIGLFFTNYKRFPLVIFGLAVVTLVFLIITPFVGQNFNDAVRSIDLGFFSVQPAEMAKVSIVALIAWVASKFQTEKDVKPKGLIICAILVVFYCALTFEQGLTNTVLLMAISFIMFLIIGVKWKKIGAILLVYGLAGGLFFAIKSYNDAAVRKLLKLPDTYRIELVISLGYPAGEARERKRKPLDEILFWNDMQTE